MSLSTKAIFAALVLSLTPVVASAQSIMLQPGPGAIINGIDIPNDVRGGSDVRPGAPAPITPVFGMDCGAQQYQYLLGHHVTIAQSYGIDARYFTPEVLGGTMDYVPQRLNISAVNNYIIDRVYCG